MKKYISLILFLCLIINLIGCYSMQDVTLDEFRSQSEKKTIYLWMQEHKYSFQGTDYLIENDTIVGRGKMEQVQYEVSNQELVEEFNGKIPLSDVKKIEMEKFNLARTLIIIPSAIGVCLFLKQLLFPGGLLWDWDFRLQK